MTFRELTTASKVALFALLTVSLGSCSIIQYTDNRSFSYALSFPEEKPQRCIAFKRTPHLGHSRPQFPTADPSKLSHEEFDEVIMTYMEKLKKYVDLEEKYLAEDMARHMETCK
jgi:hypothetical protein